VLQSLLCEEESLGILLDIAMGQVMHKTTGQPHVVAEPPWWQEPRVWPLVVVGVTLTISGLVHLVIWGIDGGPWAGPVTWRKPILFGISGGLTALSLGWVMTRLPRQRTDRFFAWSAAVALFVEVGLIDLQRWRGVASHFNRATTLDSWIYDAMGVLILWFTLVSAVVMVRVFREPVAVAADMRLAVRAGLVALVWSCLLGIWITATAELRMMEGLEPAVIGTAGVPKFAHGAVIHALQWLPLLAWAGRRAGIREQRRGWLMIAATWGTLLLAVYAIGQTVAGRPRFDGSLPLAGVLLAAVLLLGGPLLFSVVACLCRLRSRTAV